MVSGDNSILASWLIPLIILRSEEVFRLSYMCANVELRVLLATIRDKGFCPCPQCCISKSDIWKLRTAMDVGQWQTLAHHNNDEWWRKVTIAREIIYDKKFAIDNGNVEMLLKPQSLVPTLVSWNNLLWQGVQSLHRWLTGHQTWQCSMADHHLPSAAIWWSASGQQSGCPT